MGVQCLWVRSGTLTRFFGTLLDGITRMLGGVSINAIDRIPIRLLCTVLGTYNTALLLCHNDHIVIEYHLPTYSCDRVCDQD